MALNINLLNTNHHSMLQLMTDAFNAIPDFIYIMKILDGDFVYEFANSSGLAMLEQRHDIVGKTFEELLPHNKAQFLKYFYTKAVKNNSVITFVEEIDIERKQSHYETVLTPIMNNEKMFIIAVVRDVTERVLKTEQVLRANQQLEIKKQRLSSLVENSDDCVFMLNTDGFFLESNKATGKIIGYEPFELLGTSITQIVSNKELSKIRAFYQKVLEGETIQYETIFIHKHGHEVYANIKTIPMIIDGQTVGVLIIAKEKQKSKEEKVQNSRMKCQKESGEEHFQIIDKHSKNIIKILNLNGEVQYASPSLKNALGYSIRDITGNSILETLHRDDRNKIKNAIQEILCTGTTKKLNIRHIHQDGYSIWLHSQLTPIYSTEGVIKKIIVISQDITETIRKENTLKKMAYYDYLTGLPNRRLFKERLQQAMITSQKTGNLTALMLLDCDKFKKINDTLGHDIGDEVIKEFARRVKTVIWKKDTLSRVGGDEFTIIFPEVKEKEAMIDICERIISIAKDPIFINGHKIHITTSIGVAYYPVDTVNEEYLPKLADKNLYKSKERGGDCYTI